MDIKSNTLIFHSHLTKIRIGGKDNISQTICLQFYLSGKGSFVCMINCFIEMILHVKTSVLNIKTSAVLFNPVNS